MGVAEEEVVVPIALLALAETDAIQAPLQSAFRTHLVGKEVVNRLVAHLAGRRRVAGDAVINARLALVILDMISVGVAHIASAIAKILIFIGVALSTTPTIIRYILFVRITDFTLR